MFEAQKLLVFGPINFGALENSVFGASKSKISNAQTFRVCKLNFLGRKNGTFLQI